MVYNGIQIAAKCRNPKSGEEMNMNTVYKYALAWLIMTGIWGIYFCLSVAPADLMKFPLFILELVFSGISIVVGVCLFVRLTRRMG